MLSLGTDDTDVVATSHPGTRIPFGKKDGDDIRGGRVVARAVSTGDERYWEVMAPVALDGSVTVP